ncbi:fimbrial protein [Cronobacter dublinensis]|nr:fimbrial protein [Cronobacter dublinensis]
MKKTILGLAVSALFMVGAAQAETNPNDVSATLSVTGSVTANDSVCSVDLSDTSVNLNEDISTMVESGQKLNNSKTVVMNIKGDDNCKLSLEQGKLAYKFLGTADSVDGNALANTASGDVAAKGVGVGLYNDSDEVIKVNDTVTATTTGYSLKLGLVKLAGQTASVGSVQSALTIQIERL